VQLSKFFDTVQIMNFTNWIGAALLTLCLGCTENTGNLEHTAKEFCTKLGYNVSGAACMNSDSDNDGYVSCTVGVANLPPVAIECASRYKILTSGCRLTKSAMKRQ
jgi:hypothetical protein